MSTGQRWEELRCGEIVLCGRGEDVGRSLCGVWCKSGEAESSRRVIDRWEGGGEEVALLTWGDIGVLGEV